jgi:1-phosphofructokinase family hexose kinase
MLLVVSPNLSIDRILEVDGFRSSQVQRARSVLTQPGGKGSNVARVFRQLGGDVAVVGFVGRRNGQWIREPLHGIGIHVDAVEGYDGESRTCTIIRDASSNDHPTVVNEESPRVDEGAIEIMEERIDTWIGRADAVLVTGSLSRGLPEDFYGKIIEKANSRNMITAIDATGSVLRHGLEARAVLVKANLEEISAVLGPLPVEPQALTAKIQKARNRVELETIVTMGEAGAVLVAQGQAWCASPPRISKVNPIGAGDAFAAGYLKARLDGSPTVEALRFAVAVAASDAATPEPGWIVPSEVASLVSETQIRKVDVS